MPPPPPPPPSGFKVANPVSKTVNRNALLSSIEKGTKLKKTVTKDRSAPIISGKTSSVSSNNIGQISSSNSKSNSNISNGGPPQLAGLFAAGMPKLRSTGRNVLSSTSNVNNSVRPAQNIKASSNFTASKLSLAESTNKTHLMQSHQSRNNIGAPPSPKPSVKSNPAPPPPPASRKPFVKDKTINHLLPNPPVAKAATSRSVSDLTSNFQELDAPNIPVKTSIKSQMDIGQRIAVPPRPPSSSKPTILSKYNASEFNSKRPSVDRSLSMREPINRNSQNRVGTSAESPPAPLRGGLNDGHREAPPIPRIRPAVSKTVGRAAGARIMPALRHPPDRPPKPPARFVGNAPPPPSQPPPPPPSRNIKNSTIKENIPSTAISSVDHPPPTPFRNESTRGNVPYSVRSISSDFEARFSLMFKDPTQFPAPLPYKNIQKLYPSRNNAKNQRLAPQPPITNSNQTTKSIQLTAVTRNNPPLAPPHLSASVARNNPPPAPPPHAPLHIQMNKKFYGEEASHC